MKRIYSKPETLLTACESEQLISTSTLPANSSIVLEEPQAGWTKAEKDWDIWGTAK